MVFDLAAFGPVVGPSQGAFTAVAFATAAFAFASAAGQESAAFAACEDVKPTNGATISALVMLRATMRFLKLITMNPFLAVDLSLR